MVSKLSVKVRFERWHFLKPNMGHVLIYNNVISTIAVFGCFHLHSCSGNLTRIGWNWRWMEMRLRNYIRWLEFHLNVSFACGIVIYISAGCCVLISLFV